MAFFGLHGLRLALETHVGLRPPPDPSRSGSVGDFREEPGEPTGAARKATEEPPLQAWATGELGAAAPALGARSSLTAVPSTRTPEQSPNPRVQLHLKPKAITAIGNDLFISLKGKKKTEVFGSRGRKALTLLRKAEGFAPRGQKAPSPRGHAPLATGVPTRRPPGWHGSKRGPGHGGSTWGRRLGPAPAFGDKTKLFFQNANSFFFTRASFITSNSNQRNKETNIIKE